MGQVRFENFDFLVKVKGPFGQSIFSLSFFFFRRFVSGLDFQVGQTGSTDVILDVIKLRRVLGYNAWKRVASGKEVPARVSM